MTGARMLSLVAERGRAISAMIRWGVYRGAAPTAKFPLQTHPPARDAGGVFGVPETGRNPSKPHQRIPHA
jgi:hypothetical protein